MKVGYATLAVPLCVLAFSQPAATQPQELVNQFERRSLTYENLTLPYRLFVPADYDSTRSYPLVLAFHGAGERGTDNERHITVHRLATSWAEPESQTDNPAFVVAPQLPSNLRWTMDSPVDASTFTSGELTALAIVDSLQREFNIDPDRLYITGLSLGGHATWDIIARLPNRFAAAVPMSGNADATQAEKVLHLPIWAFHGESDTVVRPSSARAFVQNSEDEGRNVVYTDCHRSPVTTINFDCPGTISTDSLKRAIEQHADLIFTSLRNGGHGPWTVWYDHPLLHDWVFSKRRVDPDAVSLTSPATGDVLSDLADVTWDAIAGDAEDSVEVWLSVDRGATWQQIGSANLGDGRFTFDTTSMPDAAVASIRVFALDANGRVFARETSGLFTIDNDAESPPYLTIDDEPLRFASQIMDESLMLSVVAADPERALMTAEVQYSIDGGVTYAKIESRELPSSLEPQSIEIDLASLPNSSEGAIRVEISDGTSMTTAKTATFVKSTPRIVNDYFEHVEGDGVGIITLHFVEPEVLTNHRYRIAIDDSNPQVKTYSVTDLDADRTVLTGIPLSDGIRESPLFDGMTLVVEDLEEGMPNLEETGWITGDSDLSVTISGGLVLIAVIRVELLATEDDYEINVTDAISDTSMAGYGYPSVETYFNVTSRTDGLKRRIIYRDEGNDGRLGGGDRIYIVESDQAGELAPAWELRFSQTGSTVPPEAGDTFLFVPLRSLSSSDVFEIIAMEGVGSEQGLEIGPKTSLDVYPNPFSERMTVSFHLARPARVEIVAYDVLGRQLDVIKDGSAGAGRHRIVSNRSLASGVYLVRMSIWEAESGAARVIDKAVVGLD